MNRLILILILTFNFQILAKADDIRDFQIDGYSLNESLLNYYQVNINLFKSTSIQDMAQHYKILILH